MSRNETDRPAPNISADSGPAESLGPIRRRRRSIKLHTRGWSSRE